MSSAVDVVGIDIFLSPMRFRVSMAMRVRVGVTAFFAIHHVGVLMGMRVGMVSITILLHFSRLVSMLIMSMVVHVLRQVVPVLVGIVDMPEDSSHLHLRGVKKMALD